MFVFLAFPQDYKCAVSTLMEQRLAGFSRGENCVSSVFCNLSLFVSSMFSFFLCSHGVIVVMVLFFADEHTDQIHKLIGSGHNTSTYFNRKERVYFSYPYEHFYDCKMLL